MKILITGISGTLGRAFVALLHDDHELVGIDRNETGIATLKTAYPYMNVRVGDFDEFVFNGADIDLVIHLAAMKHIDLCETSPNATILNNLIKTHRLFHNAVEAGADILFMSTDKAVQPASVYGYSKALAEKMVVELGGAFARSGNIMDSSGSVFKIWDDAISSLEPVKVTHSEMRRFFITPQNLAKRIWEQFKTGEQEIIPEMDLDILLMELLAEKLKKAGYTIDNYPGGIVYTGLRPGEKLTERLR